MSWHATSVTAFLFSAVVAAHPAQAQMGHGGGGFHGSMGGGFHGPMNGGFRMPMNSAFRGPMNVGPHGQMTRSNFHNQSFHSHNQSFHNHDHDHDHDHHNHNQFHVFFFFGTPVFAPVPVFFSPPLPFPAFITGPVAAAPVAAAPVVSAPADAAPGAAAPVAPSVAGGNCYEFETKIRVDGQVQQAWGNACRLADGSWHIVG